MPAMDDLLPIGRFARLTGLSVGALRHYDELDILRPAEVDRFTGYRRYRREPARHGPDDRPAPRPARCRSTRSGLVLAADDPAERAPAPGRAPLPDRGADRTASSASSTSSASSAHGKEPLVSRSRPPPRSPSTSSRRPSPARG